MLMLTKELEPGNGKFFGVDKFSAQVVWTLEENVQRLTY